MSTLRDYKPLRLIVENEQDLALMSASLQDAVSKIGDFAYLPDERRFALVANRFLWECAVDRRAGPFARVRVGAHFDDVLAVRQHNLRLDAKDAVVQLLAIRLDEGEDGAGVITLEFAGGGGVRLDVESINAELRDMSDPWRTRSKPSHAV
ncbi:MAG: DUF2948 family protein [Pseudomonadota bacterium]